MKEYTCQVCGYVYNPAAGDPDAGVAPGTPFENLPDSGLSHLRRRQGDVSGRVILRRRYRDQLGTILTAPLERNFRGKSQLRG